MPASNHNDEVVKWLEERGHSPEDIAHIQAELAAYDEVTVRDALFDARSSGSFDINALIEEALKKKR